MYIKWELALKNRQRIIMCLAASVLLLLTSCSFGKIELMGGKALDKYLPSGRYRIVLERDDGNTSVEFEMKNKDNTYELVK